MKVYDCFTFYNEFELLELRLQALWDVVDRFVIVEADKTHANLPKPYNFIEHIQEYEEFLPKIHYVMYCTNVDYKGVGDWSIENAQRNAIAQGLTDAAPDDLIIVSDLDEIPAPDILQHLRENNVELIAPQVAVPIGDKQIFCPAKLLVPAMDFLEFGAIVMAQTFHYYYFDWIARKTWQGTAMIKYKNMTTPQELRTKNALAPRILNGGYHFSYMGGVDRVINKMTSIVDGNELVVKSGGKFIDRAHVEKAMANGTDVYNRKGLAESQFLPYDVHKINLPHMNEFLRKYPHFLREPEKYFKEA